MERTLHPRHYSNSVFLTAALLLGACLKGLWAYESGPSAYVVYSYGFPIPPWQANGADSKWIAPEANESNYEPPGNYDYRTTFSLSGFNPSTAVLNGQVGADNSVTIYLNGTQVATASGFSPLTPFTITSGFVSGTNTLDFVVNNAGPGSSPTGLRVGLNGTAMTNSGGGGTLVTTYSYDLIQGHLTGVSMTRGMTTQTRTFTYSGAYLVSATNPENGTVNYTYNSQKQLTKRVDAKNQEVDYTYDSYGRVTEVQRYPVSGGSEDTCQRENYYYDSNPFGGSFSNYTVSVRAIHLEEVRESC